MEFQIGIPLHTKVRRDANDQTSTNDLACMAFSNKSLQQTFPIKMVQVSQTLTSNHTFTTIIMSFIWNIGNQGRWVTSILAIEKL